MKKNHGTVTKNHRAAVIADLMLLWPVIGKFIACFESAIEEKELHTIFLDAGVIGVDRCVFTCLRTYPTLKVRSFVNGYIGKARECCVDEEVIKAAEIIVWPPSPFGKRDPEIEMMELHQKQLIAEFQREAANRQPAGA